MRCDRRIIFLFLGVISVLKVVLLGNRFHKPVPFVVACIPAYNEERSIGSVIVRTINHVDKIIVCNDGSNDLTADIAKGLGAVVVNHDRNLGKGAALKTAFSYAKCLEPDVVVMLDGDGQHDPVEIPKLVKPILGGEADIVVGSRYLLGSSFDAPTYRKFGLHLINFLSNKVGASGVRDTQSGFRAFSVPALDLVLSYEAEGYGVEMEQLALAHNSTLRVKEVPVKIRYEGLDSTSKRNPAYHGIELVDTVIRLIAEERPIFFLALPGTIIFLIGVGFGIYFLWNYYFTLNFSVPMAVIVASTIILGIFLVVSSLVLYTIKRIGKDIKE